MQTRRRIRRRVALTLQEEEEEAVRKSPLDRFNLEQANSLARQTRKAARGTKRRWSLQESEAQRWNTLGAAARLRWLARAERTSTNTHGSYKSDTGRGRTLVGCRRVGRHTRATGR